MARPPQVVVPRAGRPVGYQPGLIPPPGPPLGQRERPQAQVERSYVRPVEPGLLLTRPYYLLAVAEGGFQGEAPGHATEDVSHGRRRVRTAERDPAHRLVHLDHPDPTARRPPP